VTLAELRGEDRFVTSHLAETMARPRLQDQTRPIGLLYGGNEEVKTASICVAWAHSHHMPGTESPYFLSTLSSTGFFAWVQHRLASVDADRIVHPVT
jgi:hypothetical protein